MNRFRGQMGRARATSFAAWLSLPLVLPTLVGCAGGSSGKGRNASPGETIYVEGKVSSRGSLPFPLLLLETGDGFVYMIDASPVADELRNLEEMTVGVTAKVLPGIRGETPAISVAAYELHLLPTGERPVVGVVLVASPDDVVMRAEDGSTWTIEGEFKAVFLGLTGAKVWIAGESRGAAGPGQGVQKSIHVTQYGIIKAP